MATLTREGKGGLRKKTKKGIRLNNVIDNFIY